MKKLKYKILSKITTGDTKAHYKNKLQNLKEKKRKYKSAILDTLAITQDIANKLDNIVIQNQESNVTINEINKKNIQSEQNKINDVVRLINERDNLKPSSEKTILFCSGHGHSGNTATVDFLRGFADVDVLGPELDLFRGGFYYLEGAQSIPELYEAVKNRQALKPILNNFRRIYRFLYWKWGYCIAGPIFLEVSEEYAYACEVLENSYIKLFERFNDESSDSQLQKQYEEDFIKLSHDYLTRALNLFHPSKKITIFKHGIRFWQELDWQMPFLPDNCKIIRTIRDPRDEWADMKKRKEDEWYTPKNVDIFIESVKKERFKFLNYQHPRVTTINFEDLCCNFKDVEVKLMQFTGLDANSLKNEKIFFNPNVSKQNVGLYKNYPNQDDIRKIEEAFPQLLWKGNK